MSLRRIVFWTHLAAGVIAGSVILIMSFTGVLLTYERQIIAWSDSHHRSSPPSPGAPRLTIEALTATLAQTHPDFSPMSIAMSADPHAQVTVAAGRQAFLVDAYTGRVIAEPSSGGVRQAMSTLREWHRYLAMSGENRPFAKAITGWSNALFLFIVISGFYIWFPRKWTRASVRGVTLFNGRLTGKARDFNWHNVIGAWSCVPLALVVLTAMPISFPWASALIFRAVGEVPPPPGPAAAAPPARRSPGQRPAGTAVNLAGMDALWARAAQQEAGWRTITLRLPASSDAPVAFTIDRGDGGQPHLRSTLTLDRRTGEIVRWETFASQSQGRRLRSLSRYTHTGEVLGLAGQTIAGLASAGAVGLVYTGLALAWRRFRAWIKAGSPARAVAPAEGRQTTAA